MNTEVKPKEFQGLLASAAAVLVIVGILVVANGTEGPQLDRQKIVGLVMLLAGCIAFGVWVIRRWPEQHEEGES